MIALLRIDYRLVHGQVVFAWTNFLSADAILIANDEVAGDLFRKRTMNMSKPANTKMIFKTLDDSVKAIKSGVTDKYNLFIITETVADAYYLAKSIDGIKEINLGLVAKRNNTQNISKSVYVTPEEINQLTELENQGIIVNVKQSPTDSSIMFNSLI